MDMPLLRAVALLCVSLMLTVLDAGASALSSLPVQAAAEGQWLVRKGTYYGRYVLDKPGTWMCEPDTVIDAQGRGNAITIRVAGVRIEGCTIVNWGSNLTDMDSGIFVERQAEGAEIVRNHLTGTGFGIWVDATRNVVIRANRVEGNPDIRSQDRGNGIHLYSVTGALVANNDVWYVRDGIYIDTSNHNKLIGNALRDLRYGIHYMFSHSNDVIGNSTLRTRTGYALMQSRHLTVVGNRSEQDQNYGILLNYITYSTLKNNIITGVRQGTSGDTMIAGAEGKALFVYNSLFNHIDHNVFENSSLGIHLTAGSEDNKIYYNAFVRNQQQVKYVATRRQEWSVDGQGNYWSDYLGWDRDSNGIGDVPYEPNDNVDRLLWLYPQARLLMHSPAIELLRWVQKVFPVVKSPGVEDSFPLMVPPNRDAPVEGNLSSL